jgi:transcriptional regulator with XRE-family HTH domain
MKGSQRELCMKLKINRTTFGKFLKGEKSSTIEPVERIFDGRASGKPTLLILKIGANLKLIHLN